MTSSLSDITTMSMTSVFYKMADVNPECIQVNLNLFILRERLCTHKVFTKYQFFTLIIISSP